MANWEYKGVDISITISGEFKAQLDSDVELRTNTLAEMHQTIEKELKHVKRRKLSLKVVGIAREKRYGEKKNMVLGAAVIVGVNRTGRNYIFQGLPSTHEFDDDYGIFPDTPLNRQMIGQMIDAEQKLSALHAIASKVEIKSIGGYGRIPTAAYDGILKNLETRYAKALAESRK